MQHATGARDVSPVRSKTFPFSIQAERSLHTHRPGNYTDLRLRRDQSNICAAPVAFHR
jgi:hypothetical protein